MLRSITRRLAAARFFFPRADRTASLLAVAAWLSFGSTPSVQAQCVSLTTAGAAVTQNFDTLSNVAGSTTNNLTIAGWFLTESGGGARDNEQYAVDTGGSNTGDTYSYGAAASTDRALGALRSGTLIPIFGSCYTNNTGAVISNLAIAYSGEEWRLGTAARTDRIDFQYSLNATDLVTGTWVDVDELDFTTPDTVTVGAKDGNAASDRTALSTSITGLSIANGATFWIRWTDLDATGADDGLAVDDFSLTPNNVPTDTPTVTPSPTNTQFGGSTATDTPTVTPTATDTPTVTPSNTQLVPPTDTPTVTSTSTATPTVTATSAHTPTPTHTPRGPIITGGATAGSFTISGHSDPTCIGGQVMIFDCGFPPNCHHCTMATPCADSLIGAGTKDASGNFMIPVSPLPAAGHEIYATDGCADPGLVGPDVVVQQAAATAPLLSPRTIAWLAVLLAVVGARRLRSRVH